MADLTRRRQRAGVAAQRTGALLPRWRHDDGRRCANDTDVFSRQASEAVRESVRTQPRAVGELRRLARWPAAADGATRECLSAGDAHQCRAELARRVEAKAARAVRRLVNPGSVESEHY